MEGDFVVLLVCIPTNFDQINEIGLWEKDEIPQFNFKKTKKLRILHLP